MGNVGTPTHTWPTRLIINGYTNKQNKQKRLTRVTKDLTLNNKINPELKQSGKIIKMSSNVSQTTWSNTSVTQYRHYI